MGPLDKTPPPISRRRIIRSTNTGISVGLVLGLLLALIVLNWWVLSQTGAISLVLDPCENNNNPIREAISNNNGNNNNNPFAKTASFPKTIREAIAQSNQDAILQFLLKLPKEHYRTATKFNDDSITKKNETALNCPMDPFLSEDDFPFYCSVHNGGKVCVFPGAIVKLFRHDKYLQTEQRSFAVLNDTNYFPELYYSSKPCKTLVQENVRKIKEGGESVRNTFCSNFTFYKNFYESAFRIFKENHIVPKDLNLNTNTIVNGYDIRIIDFGLYTFKEKMPPNELDKKHKEMLDKILGEVKAKVDEFDNIRKLYCPKLSRKNGNPVPSYCDC